MERTPTDYRALCAELTFCWSRTTNPEDFAENAGPIVERMKAALAQPEALGAEPTRRQIMQLADKLGLSDLSGSLQLLQLVQEALARWGRPTIEPKATKEDVLDWLRQDRAWGTVIAPTMWRSPEDDELLDLLQRAITRFGRPTPQPFPRQPD